MDRCVALIRTMDTCARALHPAAVHVLRRCVRCPKTRRPIPRQQPLTSLPNMMTIAVLRHAPPTHRRTPPAVELRVQAKPAVALHAAELHVLRKPTARVPVLLLHAPELLTLE